MDDNQIAKKYQAGLRKGYSTIDHISDLLGLVQKQLPLNLKLYVI